MNTFLKKGAGTTCENIAYITAMSIFLPYYLSIGIIAIAAFYVLIKPEARRCAFSVPGAYVLLAFLVYSVSVALFSENYLGFLSALVFALLLILGHYIRSIMTRDLFEKLMDVCCYSSLFGLLVVIIEKLMHFSDIWYRCCGDLFSKTAISFYGHPNYLGSLMAGVIIICVYKVVAKISHKLFYYFASVSAALVVLLTESMFAWIEVFVGLTVLLVVTRSYKLLCAMFGLAALAGAVLYFVPAIFPRTAHIGSSFNSRMDIWDIALKSIKGNEWFGKGFFAYYKVSSATHGAYIAKHCHNIILDLLLCFGIIGSAIIFIMAFMFIKKLVLCKNFLKSGTATCLIISVLAAILIHSIIDMTVMWIQTGIFYLLIFSGLGAEERVIKEIFNNQTHKLQGD